MPWDVVVIVAAAVVGAVLVLVVVFGESGASGGVFLDGPMDTAVGDHSSRLTLRKSRRGYPSPSQLQMSGTLFMH